MKPLVKIKEGYCICYECSCWERERERFIDFHHGSQFGPVHPRSQCACEPRASLIWMHGPHNLDQFIPKRVCVCQGENFAAQ